MINPWRLAAAAVICEIGVVAWFAGYGPAGAEKAAPPALASLAPLLAANVAPVRALPQPTTTGAAHVAGVDIAKAAADLVKAADIETTAALSPPQPVVENPPKPIVEAALEPPEALSQEAPAVAATAEAPPADAPAPSAKDVKDPADTVANLDECPVIDTCVDRYLYALYDRTPKEDSVRNEEQHKVTVKRKGKMVTVTRTTSTVTDENFAWKDAKAADKAQMALPDYVIGGMDHAFKMRLFYLLHAAEQAGLSPGITSAFRDDYRQSIASGLHAASDRSYHGGSSHGGYGHGLAADIVSVNGATRTQRLASTEAFWKWVDVHGPAFGIGRPYLDRDPPHVGPIDGEEYVKHRGTATAHAADKKRAKLARS
jgi:hypothetical protein